MRCHVCLEGVSDEMSPFVWREAGRYPVCLEGGGEMSCLSGGRGAVRCPVCLGGGEMSC